MGLGAVVVGCAGLNVDGRFLNRDILFAQAGHAQHPRPIDRPGKAGGDAGERTGEQGFVEGTAFCVPVDQGFDQENARAAGTPSAVAGTVAEQWRRWADAAAETLGKKKS